MSISLIEHSEFVDYSLVIQLLSIMSHNHKPNERKPNNPNRNHGRSQSYRILLMIRVPASNAQILVKPGLIIVNLVAVEQTDRHGGDRGVDHVEKNDDAENDSVSDASPGQFEAGAGLEEEPNNTRNYNKNDWKYGC